jgi:hypothetical protein
MKKAEDLRDVNSGINAVVKSNKLPKAEAKAYSRPKLTELMNEANQGEVAKNRVLSIIEAGKNERR